MNNSSPEPPNRPDPWRSLWRFARRPSTLIVGGLTIAAIASAGYFGTRYFAYRQLSPLLETELSRLLKRPVKLGKVEGFWFNRIRVGPSSIPATATDRDSISIQAIEVGINPLPVLLGLPLGIDAKLIDPNIYLDQNAKGEWIALDAGRREIQRETPVKLDINLAIEDGDIALKPYALQKPVTIEVDGTGRYIDDRLQQLQYDLDASVLGSKVQIQGETALKTGKSNTTLVVDRLALGNLFALFPDRKFQVTRGIANADLSIDLPSFENIEGTRGTGQLSLTGVGGRVQPFRYPIQLDTDIDFQGQKVIFRQAIARIGKITTKIAGDIDWEKGYNLNVDLDKVDLEQLLKVLYSYQPIPLFGEARSSFRVTGKIDEPLLTGTINSTRKVTLYRIPFKSVTTNFQTNLNTLKLDNTRLIPLAGGSIAGQGNIQLKILQSLKENQEIDGTKMPIAFTAKANLPTREFFAPYVPLSSVVRVANTNATARVGGTLSRPKVLLNWRIPDAPPSETLALSGRGTIRLGTARLTLADTVLKTGGGTANITADADFKTRAVQATVKGNSFLVEPFLPLVRERAPDLFPYLQKLDPVRFNTADIRVRGKLDRLKLETLDGTADFNLQTREGTIAVNSRVSRGNLTARTITEGLPLNPFAPDLPAGTRLTRSRLTIAGSLPQLLENKANPLTTWNGQGDFQISVQNNPLFANVTLDRGFVRGSVDTSGISLAPFVRDVTVPVRLGATRVNFAGPLDPVLKNARSGLKTWRGNGNIQLFVNDRPLRTIATLDRGILSGIVTTNGLSLAPFLPNVTVPVRLGRTRVNFSSPIDTLLAGKTPDATALNANGNVSLFVSDSPINADISLINGIFNTTATLNGVRIDRLFPKLPLPVRVARARLNATGNATELIASFNADRPDFSSITATLDSRLLLAGGNVNATARLNNNLWQSQIGVAGVNTSRLVNAFGDRNLAGLPPLDGYANLSGNLNDLFRGSAPVQVREISARAGRNLLETRGNVLVTTRGFDIASVDLDVRGRSDLSRIPLQQIVSRAAIDPRFRPSGLSIAGIGSFTGRVTGKNLITAFNAPGSLQVNGDVSLAKFRLSDRVFEPFLSGTLQAGTGQNISVNLRGTEDILALDLDPCRRAGCPAPYLPLAFNIQQKFGTGAPLIARGRRQGDRLIASIERLPLEILKISPAVAYSIPGFLSGEVNADLDVNLFTLDGRGQVRIARPGVGKLRGESIVADLLYRDGVVRLADASLRAGQSAYNANGFYNFRTGQIGANLNVGRGYIQDLLAAARVSDVESLLRFFSRPDYARGRQIPPSSVGDPNAPLSEQVNLLAKIEAIIKELADTRDFVGVPTELDVRGRYSANIAIGGTIRDPNLALQFQGDRWEWRPQSPTVDIVDPLGLVTTSTQLIPIDEITVNIKANRRLLQIQPIQARSRGSRVFLAGDFSIEKVNATFGTENLSLDLVRNFVRLPLDVSGNIDTNGAIVGTLLNPRVSGNFAFQDGAINARSLDENIAGIFSYTDYRFDIRATAPESIQLYASIPYPPLPGNDRLRVQGRLGTKAIELVEAITQNSIDWISGDGEILIDATGRVDTRDGFTVKDLVANGIISLNNATIRSAAFPETLTVNGRIGLTPELLTVESLEGVFANRQITVAGTLPFFQPIAANPNPLTVTIEQGELTLENLYRGSIDGQAIVTGTIGKPVIGGEVRLSRGQISNPRPNEEALNEVDRVARSWIQPIADRNNGFTPLLENFRVVLSGLSIAQDPLYQFDFSGALTLNGPLTRPQQLRPKGVITLDRGRVSYLDTRFLLNRRNENTIVFFPDRGLLNPEIDIQLRTIVTEFNQTRDFEFARRPGEFQSSEIPDDSLNRVRRIDVNLTVEGELSRLLPNLGRNMDRVCQLRPDGLPFPDNPNYTAAELDKLATCIRTVALARGQDQQLLNSPMVQLTSSPPRSEGEIVRLLANQVLSLFDQLQDKNTEQLIQFGVVQLVIPTLAQNVLYDVENTIGNAIGATDFNVLPNLESVYRVDKKAFVRFSYDYTYNEFTIRYETRF